MNDDVDVIAEMLTTRPLTESEEATLGRVEQFVLRRDFTAQRRPRLALEILLAGIVAAVAITFIVALTRHTLTTPPPAHHSPVPTATASAGPPTPSPSARVGPPIPLRIAQQASLGSHSANAIAVSPGIVWVAVQGAVYGDSGRLLRIDASTARQTASWVVGGDPEAISAAGAYVWVVNGFGDGSLVLPDQNTVMQFNATTGRLVHLYRMTSPTAVIANGSSALVVSLPTANGPSEVHLLTAGRSSLVATVPGSLIGPSISAESAVAVCSGQVYLGVSELSASGAQSLNIYVLRLNGGPVRTLATIQGAWWPAMTCDQSSLFAFDGAGDPPLVVNTADGRVRTLPEGAGASAVAFESGSIWQLHNAYGPPGSGGYLTALDPNTGLVSSTRLTIPGTVDSEAFLLAQGTPGLWVVGGNETLLLHVVFG